MIGNNQRAGYREQGVAREQLSIRRLPIGCAEHDGDRSVQHRIAPIALGELVGSEITLQVKEIDAIEERDRYLDSLERSPSLCDVEHIVEH